MARLRNLTALFSVFLLMFSSGEADAQRTRGGFQGRQVSGRIYNRPAFHYGQRYRGGFARPYAGFGFGYSPFFAPRIGFGFGYLPWGFSPFAWGPNTFYYNNGIFLGPYNNGTYRVIAPPLGAEVQKLPRRANKLTIKDEVYYERDGVLYQPVTTDDGGTVYRIAGKNGRLASPEEIDRALNGRKNRIDEPASETERAGDADQTSNNGLPWVGDVVDVLPKGTKPVTLNGKTYFVSPADVYYEKTGEYGKEQYRVLRTPASEDPEKD